MPFIIRRPVRLLPSQKITAGPSGGRYTWLGRKRSDFDRRFLDDLTRDPQRLIEMPHIEYVREAGAEGIELAMWLIMLGALNEDITEVYRHYHVPASNTATGLIIFENDAERTTFNRAS